VSGRRSTAREIMLASLLAIGCGGGNRDVTAPPGGDTGPVIPTPAITSITPARVCAGATFTLVVRGTGFVPQSQVRIDGAPRATTVVSESELRTEITTSDLVNGSLAVSVANGAKSSAASTTLTVGGSSAAVLTGAPTGAVATGQPSFALSIDGSGFTPTTVASWGATRRPTRYLSPTRIVATIDAQDVAAPNKVTISAVDTVDFCRSTSGLPFEVLAIGAATSSDLKSIATTATALLWHAGTGRLLVTSRAGDLTADYLFAIDPATGRATDSLLIGHEPGRMTMTDDGKFLFVQVNTLDTPQIVKRVQISPLAVLSQFTVGGSISDLAAVPGSNTSVAVVRGGGVAVYDSDIARPVAQGGGESITFGDAGLIYGYAGYSPAAIWTNALSADGVRVRSEVEGFFTGTNTYLRYRAGRLYLSSGYVFDVNQMDEIAGYIGRAPTDWDVKSGDALVVDDRRGRAYEIHNGRLTAWDLNSFQPIGSVKVAPAPQYGPYVFFLSDAARWGADGLAYHDLNALYIFRSPLIAP
jgi:hypothetical protein